MESHLKVILQLNVDYVSIPYLKILKFSIKFTIPSIFISKQIQISTGMQIWPRDL